jgi:hypothetical protein
LASATQPAKKGAFEQPDIQPVGLRPPVLARDGDARWMDHVSFNAVCAQPARQPEAVAAGLEGDGNARDRAARLGRLIAPAVQQSEQCILVRLELLLRMPVDPGNDPPDQPT